MLINILLRIKKVRVPSYSKSSRKSQKVVLSGHKLLMMPEDVNVYSKLTKMARVIYCIIAPKASAEGACIISKMGYY